VCMLRLTRVACRRSAEREPGFLRKAFTSLSHQTVAAASTTAFATAGAQPCSPSCRYKRAAVLSSQGMREAVFHELSVTTRRLRGLKVPVKGMLACMRGPASVQLSKPTVRNVFHTSAVVLYTEDQFRSCSCTRIFSWQAPNV
jgi:hypothetical protein